jgi:hypothetical protein
MAQILNRVLDLRRREIGELHRGRGQRHKAIPMLLAPGRKAVIRRAHDPVCETAVFRRVPPVAVDAQRLNVDTAPVHLLNALHIQRPAPGVASEFRICDDRPHLIDGGMRMDVHHSHAPARDLHFPARHRAGGLRYLTRTSATLPISAPLRIRIRGAAANG